MKHVLAALMSLSAAWLSPLLMASEAGDDLETRISRLLDSQAAEAYPGAMIEVTVKGLDPRLVLPACTDIALDPRGQNVHGRVSVEARCHAPSPWSVFVTATVKVSLPVVVTTSPLPRGTVIRPEHVTLAERDISGQRALVSRRVEDVVGMALRRPLEAGAPIQATQITAPVEVQRGDRVTIVATRGSVRITTPGESLESGRRGDQIRVRNRHTRKVIDAWVSGPGKVQLYAAAL